MKYITFLLVASVLLVSGCLCCQSPGSERHPCAGIVNDLDRDDCYMQEAVVNEDEGDCHKVSDDYMRRMCYPMASTDEKRCDEWFTGEDLAYCYSAVAYLKEDKSVCDQLPSDLVNYCYSEYDEY